jgi:hypothetical protein
MKIYLKKLPLLLFVLPLLITMAACNNAGLSAGAPGPFDGEKIVVHGLKDQDFEITLGELKTLPVVTRHGQARQSNGQTVNVKATGPLLDTFLKQYGKTQQDFSRIRFSAKDNYSIAVPHDILENREVILSYINDGKPLEDDWQPLRIVIPGERSMYWVRSMNRIDFETGDSQESVNKVVFLKTAAENLPQEDYKYFDSTDKAIKTKDLITKYADINDQTVTNVCMMASDGLKKNETKANFLTAYIKITGQEAPKFIAPQFPEGMHIRDLFCIIYGQTAIFDYAESITCLPKQTVAEQEGVSLSQIVKQTGLAGGNRYKFNDADGKSIELETADLGNGLIYENTGGALAFISSGVSGYNRVDNLLSIEVLP